VAWQGITNGTDFDISVKIFNSAGQNLTASLSQGGKDLAALLLLLMPGESSLTIPLTIVGIVVALVVIVVIVIKKRS